MLHFVAILLCLSLTQVEKPEALRRMEDARRRPTCGRIEWMRSGESLNGREEYATSRFVGCDHLRIIHGDKDGVMRPAQLGEYFSCSKDYVLLKNREQWTHTEDTPTVVAYVNPASFRPMFDIRTLGLTPTGHAWLTLDRLSPNPAESYSERVDGPIHEVTARSANGSEQTWYIDESKDYAPVRCTYTSGGVLVSECRAEYEQFGDVWFPRQATFFIRGKKVKQVTVLSAAFDDPADFRELTLNDLDIYPGCNLGREGLNEVRMWDGHTAISPEDYFKGVEEGRIDNSRYKAFLDDVKKGKGQGRTPKTYDLETLGLAGAAYEPGLWEEFVRRFIFRHRLNLDQTRQAWRIHKECQGQAYEYMQKHRKEFDDLEKDTGDARQIEAKDPKATNQASTSQPAHAVKAIEKQRERLLGPVQMIFDRKLKPRLERLLTPEQQAALTTQPSTR